jgi:hypothetical protein
MNRNMRRVRASLAPEIKYRVSKINPFSVKTVLRGNLFRFLRTIQDILELLLAYSNVL